MKHSPTSIIPLLALGLLALGLTACPDSRARNGDQTERGLPALGQAGATEDLKSYPFAKRAEFDVSIRTAAAKLDGQITELGARLSAEASADPARSKALEDVKSARAALEEQLGKLGNVAAENWESVRDSVIDALNRTQTAYDQAVKG